jgi:hypothetical protein
MLESNFMIKGKSERIKYQLLSEKMECFGGETQATSPSQHSSGVAREIL